VVLVIDGLVAKVVVDLMAKKTEKKKCGAQSTETNGTVPGDGLFI